MFPVTYTEGGAYAFTVGTATSTGQFGVPGTAGVSISTDASTLAAPATGLSTVASVTTRDDWYDNQYIQLDNGQVLWKSVAEKPGTSGFAAARNSENDQLHVVVVDDKGSISGNAGTILEKHAFLSKATDAVNSLGSQVYYKDYIADNSNYLFVGVLLVMVQLLLVFRLHLPQLPQVTSGVQKLRMLPSTLQVINFTLLLLVRITVEPTMKVVTPQHSVMSSVVMNSLRMRQNTP